MLTAILALPFAFSFSSDKSSLSLSKENPCKSLNDNIVCILSLKTSEQVQENGAYNNEENNETLSFSKSFLLNALDLCEFIHYCRI